MAFPLRSSVQLSHSVVSDSLRPHGPQQARLPCPLPTAGVYSNSCPLSQWCHPNISSFASPSPTFNLSQHQGLFQWVCSSHQVAKVLEFQLQHQSLQWIVRTDFLEDWLVGSPWSPRDSQESSRDNTTVQKHQFFTDQFSLWSNSHSHTWPLEKL